MSILEIYRAFVNNQMFNKKIWKSLDKTRTAHSYFYIYVLLQFYNSKLQFHTFLLWLVSNNNKAANGPFSTNLSFSLKMCKINCPVLSIASQSVSWQPTLFSKGSHLFQGKMLRNGKVINDTSCKTYTFLWRVYLFQR